MSPKIVGLVSTAVAVAVCSLCSPATVVASDTGAANSGSVAEQIEKLGDRRGAYLATKELAERGDEIVPELITALEHALDEIAQYDPRNLGDQKKAYSSLLDKQNNLMSIIGSKGNLGHVSRLIPLADKFQSESMVVPSYFVMLQNLGGQKVADRIAARIIADPKSDGTKLFAAMTRYYRRTPADVADSAAQHFDKELSIVRGMAYQLVINAGGAADVKARLIDEVGKLEYTGSGNKTMLHALAVIEEPDSFLPRLEVVRLRPDVKETAMLVSRFSWASDEGRESMLPDMLGTDNSELDLYAIEFMLENDRSDLLEQHRLAWPGMRQFEYYELLIPGFADMPRERLLRHLSPEEVDRIERQKSNPIKPMTSPRMRLALRHFGYGLKKKDGRVVIIPPPEKGV